jgi:SAM-dependent methyltransferase
MQASYNKNWNEEYKTKGIPSSFRASPSASITWFVKNLECFTDKPSSDLSVLDLGCGAGRNSIYLASLNYTVTGVDASDEAIVLVQSRMPEGTKLSFLKHNLASGIPFKDQTFDILTDIFVYKHQISFDERVKYRQEMSRVLSKQGVVLLSLADSEDGYYSKCPDVKEEILGNPRTIIDPVVNIASVLFSFEELKNEMSDQFECEMMWRKNSVSEMHGRIYPRTVLTSVWRKK